MRVTPTLLKMIETDDGKQLDLEKSVLIATNGN